MPSLREAGLRHARYYESVLRNANESYQQGGESTREGLILLDSEWDNIQTGQTWATAFMEVDNNAAQLCSDYPEAGVYILDLRQSFHNRIDWRESALAAARELKRRDAEAVHLGNIGIAYADLGNASKAIEYHNGHLKIAQELAD